MKDLSITHPKLYQEWHFEKNILLPEEYKTSDKVWWKCKNGHEWQALINNRKSHNSGCPYCKNKKVSKDNNLFTICPELCKEWDYEKNSLSPKDYTYRSNKKVWWKCAKGHSWEASPNTRIKGHGCPYCSGKNITLNESLFYKYPELCKEWDYEKNNISPKQCSPKSNRKVWWKCENGHSWQTSISVRTSGHKCPYCAGQRATEDMNVTVLYPEICKYFDYNKNKYNLKHYLPNSNQKVWWKCENGHSFKLAVQKFIKRVNKCLICNKKIASEDYNLLLIYPELCKEWNYEKNYLTPDKYTPYSKKKVWWKCRSGHVWNANISNRTIHNTNCPKCSHRSVSLSCTKWLDTLGILSDNREIKIEKYIVDGLQNNIVYEYLGDFWHGNPTTFHPDNKNCVTKEKYGKILCNTIFRLNTISEHYKIIYRWESGKENKIYKPIYINTHKILEVAKKIYNKDSDILEELC
jgi:hypothetical protein